MSRFVILGPFGVDAETLKVAAAAHWSEIRKDDWPEEMPDNTVTETNEFLRGNHCFIIDAQQMREV